MDELNAENFLQNQGTQIDARDLKGQVRVMSPSQFASLLRRKVEEARADALRQAIGPGDVPKMLDSYLRENVNLKARNESQAVKISEYERKIVELEEKIGRLGQGASQVSGAEKFLGYDPSPVRAVIDKLSGILGETETGLNEVENMEESWVFIEKIASIRTEVNRLKEEFEKNEAAFGSLCAAPQPGAVELAETVKEFAAIEREAKATEKAVLLVRSLLGFE